MSHWQLQTAKNKFSELVDHALVDGPQMITRHGKATAVVLSVNDYQKMLTDKGPLSNFFARSPLREAKLDLSRSRDTGRGPLEL